MENKDYLLPGIAALLLAVIHPFYWLGVGPLIEDNSMLWQDIIYVGFDDFLFALIILLNIYIYLSLKNILNEQLNFNHIDLLVMILIIINAIWLSTLFLDLSSAVLPDSLITQNKGIFLNIYVVVGIGAIIAIGLVDLLIGVLLLMKLKEAPTLLKIFAVTSLIQGIVGMTIFLAGILIFVVPITLVILAMFFLRKPESIEIV
tara:strand:+ start:818 stop:1426 length:609 start_codon:yes stop_codon:yes gene_type:complete